MDDGTDKDLVVGAAGVATAGAAAAVPGGSMAMAMAAVVMLVGVAYTAFMGRDTRRSERLFRTMAEADEHPDDFVAHLNERLREGDDEMLTKLRALIRADLESASDAAYEPIARLGHAYVRGKAPGWAARGWVRIFAEITSTEIDTLKELAIDLRKALEATAAVAELHQKLIDEDAMDVVVFLGRGYSSAVATSSQIRSRTPTHLQAYPSRAHFGLEREGNDDSLRLLETPSATRLFDLFAVHALGSPRAPMVEPMRNREHQKELRPAIQFPRAAAEALCLAFGV